MRSISTLLSFLLIAFCSAYSQSNSLSDWTHLIDAGKRDAAMRLCLSYVNSPTTSERVEAQKCLANVALMGHDIVMLQGDDAGGGSISGGYTKDAVDEALVHLNLALKLAPQDLSIHEGRLHILEVSGRYSEMIKALDRSCSIYKGPDPVDDWLPYVGELNELRQYQVALEFSKVMDAHYPNNPDIVGNIGAFLMLLNKPIEEAMPYLKEAEKLAPKDSINAWNLGRAYDYGNQNHLADTWYQRGLSLEADKAQLASESCLYGHFVTEKLKDADRGCFLVKQYCDASDRKDCIEEKSRDPQPAESRP